MLNIFLEFVDLPADKKLEYIKTVIVAGTTGLEWQPEEQDTDKFFEGFKKQLSSLSLTEVDGFESSAIKCSSQVEEKTICVSWSNESVHMNFLQLLATKESEMNLGILQLLLDHG